MESGVSSIFGGAYYMGKYGKLQGKKNIINDDSVARNNNQIRMQYSYFWLQENNFFFIQQINFVVGLEDEP